MKEKEDKIRDQKTEIIKIKELIHNLTKKIDEKDEIIAQLNALLDYNKNYEAKKMQKLMIDLSEFIQKISTRNK